MLTYWTPVRGVLFGFVAVPKTSIWQCLFADIIYETSMAWVLSPTPFLAWYGFNKVFINQAEGWVHPQGLVLVQFPMAVVMHYSTCALLFLSWTANALFCCLNISCGECVHWVYPCSSNAQRIYLTIWHFYTENYSTVKTDLSNQHLTCTYCTKRLVEF